MGWSFRACGPTHRSNPLDSGWYFRGSCLIYLPIIYSV
jgi:hypothetical protein